MHDEAYAYVRSHQTAERLAVLELGGRVINGDVKHLFPNAHPYVSLDICAGAGVDIVANAATWEPDRSYDLVVCTEVFEHTEEWPAILRTALKACVPGGRVILTMAGPGRSPHGAAGGTWDGVEHYANVSPEDLQTEMEAAGWSAIDVDYLPTPGDTRATAVRPEARGV